VQSGQTDHSFLRVSLIPVFFSGLPDGLRESSIRSGVQNTLPDFLFSLLSE
jgi:hypothetical protein